MTDRQKILVVRVGRAGDVVMITPALRALLAALPDAEFHLLTAADGARVLRGFDARVTRTWIYSRRFPRSWLAKGALARAFAREGYTRAYIFEVKPTYRRWLRPVVGTTYECPPAAPGVHFSELCLRAVDASLETPVPRGWVELPVTDAGRAAARALFQDAGVSMDNLVVGLHPTFSGSRLPFFRDRTGQRHRHWPRAHFVRLAGLLRERARAAGRRISLVIDALPADEPLVAPLAAAADGAVTLLVAPPDFQRYKALLAGLDLLITPNTGPMHIAAAVGTPLVALFSRWDPADCGPFMAPERYEVLRAEDTPAPERGLRAIAPEAVADAAWRVLARTGGGE